MNSSAPNPDWGESPSASEAGRKHTAGVFGNLIERSADAIWLHEVLDPRTAVLVDCNQAAIDLIGAESKQQLLHTRPEEISPPMQPDGSCSADKAAEIIAIVEKERRYRFEWVIRKLDGRDVPVEISSTAVSLTE